MPHPLYRNWPVLCQVSRENNLFMIVLATVDLTTPLGRRLATAFPDCFSETQVRGPVPLSLLVAEARTTSIACVLVAHQMSYMQFDTTPKSQVDNSCTDLPPNIPSNAKTGFEVEHGGMKWVVVEHNDNPRVNGLTISPAQYIDIGA